MTGLTPDEAAAVLRRAAELDAADPHDDERLDERVLREAAQEVGLSGEAVDRAVRELRAGALQPLPPLPPDRRAGLPVLVTVERTHPLPPDRLAAGLDAWLRGQWFAPRRRRGDACDWEPRTGSLARARRAVDLGRHLRLADVRRLRVETGSGSRVRLTADLGDLRTGMLVGWVAAPTALVGGVTALAVGAGPELLLAGPAGLAAGGAGWLSARRTLEVRTARVREELELALDQLPAAPPRPAWRRLAR